MGVTHHIREVTLGGRFASEDYPYYSNLPWVEPFLIEGYETNRESRHIVHNILGRREPDITFREPSLRSGRLRMFFRNAWELRNAEQTFALAEVLQLDTKYSDNSDYLRMCFVIVGDMSTELTDTKQWVITLEYQEVSPPPIPVAP